MENQSPRIERQDEQEWFGLHGLQRTNIGHTESVMFEGGDEALQAFGLPPRQPGEDWFTWDVRTNGGVIFDSPEQLTQEMEAQEGEQSG